MKIRVDRDGRKFENVTEVKDGVVISNSVKNLSDAVIDDPDYSEDNPVMLVAAKNGVKDSNQWANTMTDLVDKAKDAKVTPENVGVGKEIVKNMYTKQEELDESYQVMHLILNEDLEETETGNQKD